MSTDDRPKDGGTHDQEPARERPAGAPSDRARVRRLPARGRYDRPTVDAILDEGLVCHVGFSAGSTTWVLPMAYGRDGDDLYLHGAKANHALRSLAGGAEACVTVTLVDGLVLAKAAFHHSMNYRSVVLFGRAHPVEVPAEQRHALGVVVDHVVPGRAVDARPPTEQELRATTLLRLRIDEASAKVRTGGPVDDDEDRGLEVWSGVVPVALRAGVPEPDAFAGTAAVPGYATSYRRPGCFGTGGPDG